MLTRLLAIVALAAWWIAAAAIVASAAPPSMSSIQAVFERPTTTYSVTITGADPQSFEFDWTKQQANPCGTFTQSGPEATWSHPDLSLGGNCPDENFHPATITIEAFSKDWRCTATYPNGSAGGPPTAPLFGPPGTCVAVSQGSPGASTPAPGGGGGGGPNGTLIAGGVVVLAGAAGIGIYAATRTKATDCSKQEAAVKAAIDAVAAAEKAFKPIADLRQAAQQAANELKAAQEAEAAARAGAIDQGEQPGGGKHVLTYKSSAQRKAHQEAQAQLGPAQAKADAAQKSFDSAGGVAAWDNASLALDSARRALQRAEESLARCQGAGPTAPGTTTSTPGTTSGGTPPPPPPPTEPPKPPVAVTPPPKDPCEGQESPRTSITINQIVSEHQLSQAKLTQAKMATGEGGDIKNLLNTFDTAKEWVGIGQALIGAVADPVGSIAGQLQSGAGLSVPSYSDQMMGLVPDALRGLIEKLDNVADGQWMVAWPVVRYRVVCSITCACTAGQWVVTSRSFRVFRIGKTSTKPSDWFFAATKEDLAHEVQVATARARDENGRVAKQILGWQTDCNAGGCSSGVVGPPPGDPEPPGSY
ncbi:MAG TPA: hypothetical protein VIJ58_00930 [Candidatus Dormibacteraeota bacterium]